MKELPLSQDTKSLGERMEEAYRTGRLFVSRERGLLQDTAEVRELSQALFLALAKDIRNFVGSSGSVKVEGKILKQGVAILVSAFNGATCTTEIGLYDLDAGQSFYLGYVQEICT